MAQVVEQVSWEYNETITILYIYTIYSVYTILPKNVQDTYLMTQVGHDSEERSTLWVSSYLTLKIL